MHNVLGGGGGGGVALQTNGKDSIFLFIENKLFN